LKRHPAGVAGAVIAVSSTAMAHLLRFCDRSAETLLHRTCETVATGDIPA